MMVLESATTPVPSVTSDAVSWKSPVIPFPMNVLDLMSARPRLNTAAPCPNRPWALAVNVAA